jgi:hypothetical protein
MDPTAATAQYGPVLAEYGPVGGLVRRLAVLGLVCGSIGGCLLVEAAGSRLGGGAKLAMAGMALLCLGVIGYMAWRIVPNLHRRVQVVADGLVIHRGSQVDRCRWQDVTSVRQLVARGYRNGIYTGTTHLYWIDRVTGPQLVFDDLLRGVEALGDTIQAQTLPHLLQQALDRYNSGGSVQFGKIAVSPQGVYNGKETLPWSAIQGVKLDQGFIAVNTQGQWRRWTHLRIGKTPNIYVFVAMVNRIIGLS